MIDSRSKIRGIKPSFFVPSPDIIQILRSKTKLTDDEIIKLSNKEAWQEIYKVEAEAREYFKDKVYQTVVPRNVRLSEAPSHGVPVLIYDKTCPGSKSYFNFTEEFLDKEKTMESAA